MPAGRSHVDDRVRHRLTGPAWALLALAAFALLLWLADSQLHVAIGAAIVAAVATDGVLSHRAVSRVQLEVRNPSETLAGEPTPLVVQAHGWTRPVTLTPLLVARTADLLVTDGRPGLLLWPPMSRGVVPFVVVDLTANGPLGLVSSGRRVLHWLPQPLHVAPRPVPRDVPWPRPRAVGFGLVEGAPLGDDLFRSVRPYRYGDERRRIHWKATARQGELMVRESDGTGQVRVRVVVDLGPPGPMADLAAGWAGWVIEESLGRGWTVELATLDSGGRGPLPGHLGRTFGLGPRLAEPELLALPTVVARVRTPAEARRRLATAAHGTPAAGSRRDGLTCQVTPEGVAWS